MIRLDKFMMKNKIYNFKYQKIKKNMMRNM